MGRTHGHETELTEGLRYQVGERFKTCLLLVYLMATNRETCGTIVSLATPCTELYRCLKKDQFRAKIVINPTKVGRDYAFTP